MDNFTKFIYLILITKFLFIALSALFVILKIKKLNNTPLAQNLIYWIERLEFIFTILMAVLLVYIFNPHKNRLYRINNETKLLLFLFGYVLIFTAKWNIFFEEAKWFKYLQEIIGDRNLVSTK